MNTPAHLLVGTALFSKANHKHTYLAALFGAILPDLSLYVMAAVSILIMGVPGKTVFNEYYYSEAWQSVFAVDNSFILWGALLGLALWRRWPLVTAFAAAGIAHIALDFPLHTHDARMHFWPVSTWVFESPFSYWDHRAHAGIIGPLEFSLSAGMAALLWVKFQSTGIRIATIVFLTMEVLTSGIWRFVF